MDEAMRGCSVILKELEGPIQMNDKGPQRMGGKPESDTGQPQNHCKALNVTEAHQRSARCASLYLFPETRFQAAIEHPALQVVHVSNAALCVEQVQPLGRKREGEAEGEGGGRHNAP